MNPALYPASARVQLAEITAFASGGRPRGAEQRSSGEREREKRECKEPAGDSSVSVCHPSTWSLHSSPTPISLSLWHINNSPRTLFLYLHFLYSRFSINTVSIYPVLYHCFRFTFLVFKILIAIIKQT